MSGTIVSGSAGLATSEWGSGNSSIVALHPGVGDRRIWADCAETWADAGHHVVAYDRRGFGDTTYEPEPHDELDDLDAVLSACTSGAVCLVGNSRGGGLAIDFALAHPARVASLVLISPSPSGFPYETWNSVPSERDLDEQVDAAEQAGDLDLLNRLEVRYWLDGVDQSEGRVSGAARELMYEMNGRALAATPPGNSIAPDPAWPRRSEIRQPTLVLVGEHDLPGCHDIGRDLVAAMTEARLETVADAAHCPSLDQPDALSTLVLDFLR